MAMGPEGVRWGVTDTEAHGGAREEDAPARAGRVLSKWACGVTKIDSGLDGQKRARRSFCMYCNGVTCCIYNYREGSTAKAGSFFQPVEIKECSNKMRLLLATSKLQEVIDLMCVRAEKSSESKMAPAA